MTQAHTVDARPEPWVIIWTEKQDEHCAVPLSFARGSEGRCPFEVTLALARALAPAERVSPVVLRPEKPWWRQPLDDVPSENWAEQPFDRGTAPGILLAILRIFRKDPLARIVLLADQQGAERLPEVDEALLQTADDSVLFVAPARMGRPAGQRGAVVIGSAQSLLQLFVETQPEVTEQFLTSLEGPLLFDGDALDRLYPFLPEIDFRAEVLARVPDRTFAPLRVVADVDPGLGSR